MLSPYAILDVAETANDEEVKKAYLTKVREHPPERDPQKFQRIRRAYETLKTEKNRLRYRLFHIAPPDLELLEEKWLAVGEPHPPSEKILAALLSHAVRTCRIDKG